MKASDLAVLNLVLAIRQVADWDTVSEESDDIGDSVARALFNDDSYARERVGELVTSIVRIIRDRR